MARLPAGKVKGGIAMQRDERESQFMPRLLSFFLKRVRKDKPFVLPDNITKSARLLFIDSGNVTDLLFAAPVVKWFHEKFPDIKTTMLVIADNADVAKSIMKVNNIIAYDRKQLRFYKSDYYSLIRKLRQQYIETVIMLGRGISPERHFLALACGAATRIGYHHQLAFPFINCEVRVSSEAYEGERIIRLIESLGLRTGGVGRGITLPPSDINHAKQLIHFRKPEKDVLTVGVDPGRSKSRHSVIPEIIAYLANNLAGRRRVKFLALTDPWDGKLIDKITRELKGEVIDLVPSGSRETLALLSQCDLFLSGNTNLFHFAAALNVPSIGLFTRYDGKEWVPTATSNVRIFKGTRGEKLSLKGFFTKVEEVLTSNGSIPV
jgi:heptosyltransferase-2